MGLAELTRNAVHVLPAGALEAKLALGRPLRVKLGIDVTSPDIHVGRAVPLQRMAAFQREGHLGVLIVGGMMVMLLLWEYMPPHLHAKAAAVPRAMYFCAFHVVGGLLSIVGLLYFLLSGLSSFVGDAAQGSTWWVLPSALFLSGWVILCAFHLTSGGKIRAGK